MTNAEIADRLMSLAQSLAAQKENPFKVKAYRQAAKTIRTLPDSIAGLVQKDADLTGYAGIGKSIAAAIRELVLNGASSKVDAMLLYRAEQVAASIEVFLWTQCGVKRAVAVGDFRRRVETVGELSFLVESGDFGAVLSKMEEYGGGTERLSAGVFRLPSGIPLHLRNAIPEKWGLEMLASTGSGEHLRQLEAAGAGLLKLAGGKAAYREEAAVYRKLKLAYIEPELREGRDEVERAARGDLPALIQCGDIRGELHAHSTSSDGVHTIEQMARAAQAKGYEYTGITDHSQSLKIAGGLSEDALRRQIRLIEKLNGKAGEFRILKSAEVDILEDGRLDYPDDLLRELDYTVCSIHSKFSLGKAKQTERILRAMDNRYFTILGHATGRRLLQRPGYEIDVERVMRHAQENGCFVEMNANPQRLDVSAKNARVAAEAGVKIAISTDAHSTGEYEFVRYGVDQARRAGLTKEAVLNTRSWEELRGLFRRG